MSEKPKFFAEQYSEDAASVSVRDAVITAIEQYEFHKEDLPEEIMIQGYVLDRPKKEYFEKFIEYIQESIEEDFNYDEGAPIDLPETAMEKWEAFVDDMIENLDSRTLAPAGEVFAVKTAEYVGRETKLGTELAQKTIKK